MTSSEPANTVAEQIRASYSELTRSERKLADCLMASYPMAGLESITEFAKAGDVSTPTVLRMIKKLGYSGFPVFQAVLRQELGDTLSSPIVKHERWHGAAPEEHVLTRFAAASFDNLTQTLNQLDYQVFDKIAALLADPERGVYIGGGRITHAIADYLFTHLQVIRKNIQQLTGASGAWHHHLLNMNQGDVLVIFDVRRYENDLVKFAELAHGRGVQVVLFTDQWMSPVSAYACHAINVRIEVPSAWDSAVVTLFLMEALIAEVESQNWQETCQRMNELEDILNATQRFRKQP